MSIRYYISSRDMDAKVFTHTIKAHWKIESMQRMLNVKMNEDSCRLGGKKILLNYFQA